MILSDRTIREQLAAGRIVIDPLDESCIQPSSVDLHIDRYFRVFRNHTMRVIDVKEHQEELTELVEIGQGDVFILHPGEFVLGSTLERVALPDDLVARLEGKSSLGRLGLLIHSSLPASEPVLVLEDGRLRQRPIGEIVDQRIAGSVVGFDPETLEVGYHPITGWYEGPPDRIYEVRLDSGRKVRVTAGHNLFSLDRDGEIKKLRSQELTPGTFVAVPGPIPGPADGRAVHDLAELALGNRRGETAVEGSALGRGVARESVTVLRRDDENELSTSVPLPDRLLVASRLRVGLSQEAAASAIGVLDAQLLNLETRHNADAVGVSTLRRIFDSYERESPAHPSVARLGQLAHSDVRWDRVTEVVDTGSCEPVYDLEVRPGGRKIENFVAGSGGVFASNTAGFVDCGFSGHLTLELSNVANLPITLYPGMKIGQISFLQMTSSAEHPYGSREAGSKYQHQRGPTPSRYFENFQPREEG